jgi:hypothetical protein
MTGCGSDQLMTTNETTKKLEAFKSKEKYVEDTAIFYPGISDKSLRPLLTEKLNLATDDFIVLSSRGNASEKEYLEKIETGLKRFADIYENLDTEDRERTCKYFEELMDIVGLESSGGHLNNFMYGGLLTD